MTDLRDLYQEVILDHNKRPRNFGSLEGASHQAEGYNPLCGDQFTVFLTLDGDVVKDVRFEGTGCAISTASASVMTESLKGKTRVEVETLFRKFHTMVTGDPTGDALEAGLGKLAVFSGVREFPIRVKCATLPWHTFQAALKDDRKTITTE